MRHQNKTGVTFHGITRLTVSLDLAVPSLWGLRVATVNNKSWTPVLDCESYSEYYKCVSGEILNVLLFSLLGSSLILLQENAKEFYPELLSNVTIECDCVNISCASVLWFRTIPSNNKVQFLGYSNNADRFSHGKDVKAARFKFSRRSNGPYLLRIIKVTQEDEGFYSCVLRDLRGAEVWRPGNLLWPGGLYAKILCAAITAVKY